MSQQPPELPTGDPPHSPAPHDPPASDPAPLGPPTSVKYATPTDRARFWLMLCLVGIFAFVIVGSYIYDWHTRTPSTTWLEPVLPVVAGLVGAAGGFYFGEHQNK